MFDSEEADALLSSLKKRLSNLRKAVEKLVREQLEKEKEAGLGKRKVQDQLAEEQALEMVRETLFMENAFRNIPTSQLLQGTTKTNAISLTEQIDFSPDSYPENVREIFRQFNMVKEENGLAYKEGLKRSFIATVKDCPEIGSKMSEKEMFETGRMMSIACSGKEQVKELVDQGRDLVNKIISE